MQWYVRKMTPIDGFLRLLLVGSIPLLGSLAACDPSRIGGSDPIVADLPDTSIPIESDLGPAESDLTLDQDPAETDAAEATPTPTPLKIEPLKLYTIKNATQRKAICNDGTPGTFYARRGWGANANKWIIHFQGGASCWSKDGCDDRWTTKRSRMSSASYKQSENFAGLFSQDALENPDFYDWTHVYLKYCSSDQWAGNNGQSPATHGWHFRGKSIFKAAIEDLQNIKGSVGLSYAEEVLLTGSSAGGAGLKYNIDHLVGMLAGIPIKGVLDSSYASGIQDVLPPNTAKDAYVLAGRIAAWNPVLDASCMAAFNDKPTCMSAPNDLSHIETPTFVYVDQHDSLAVEKYAGDAQLIAAHAKNVRDALALLPGAFSTRSGYHTALHASKRFFQTKVNNKNYATVLANWVFDRPGPKNVVRP